MQHGEFWKIAHFPLCIYLSIEQDRASTNIISNFETIELQHNFVIIPAPKCKQVNIQTSVQACYRQKLKQIKKVLYKKKIKIYQQRKQINELRKRNKWEEIVTERFLICTKDFFGYD